MYLLVKFYQDTDLKRKEKKKQEKDAKFMLDSFNKILDLDNEELKDQIESS
jgi:hypothetical protein